MKEQIKSHEAKMQKTLDVLSKVGGLDIAGMAGFYLGAALHHVPVVLDGAISAAAALLAVRLCPDAAKALIASHRSAEPSSGLLLDALGLRPIVSADLKLGEGTGAVAVMPLLDMGLAVYREMASFDDVKIEAYQPLGGEDEC